MLLIVSKSHSTQYPWFVFLNPLALTPLTKIMFWIEALCSCWYYLHTPHWDECPPLFMVNALLSATYVHNFLPSPPLGRVIPLIYLYLASTLLSLSLSLSLPSTHTHTLGYNTFVYDHTPLSRLAPISLNGVSLATLRLKRDIMYTLLHWNELLRLPQRYFIFLPSPNTSKIHLVPPFPLSPSSFLLRGSLHLCLPLSCRHCHHHPRQPITFSSRSKFTITYHWHPIPKMPSPFWGTYQPKPFLCSW